MILSILAMALLVLAARTTCYPFESTKDQYQTLEEEPLQIVQATDQLSILGQNNLIKRLISTDNKENNPRGKRSYYPWTGSTIQAAPYVSFTVWKPPLYALSRPYFIPIYGAPGRQPMYFPPQQILINPGIPSNNPPRKPPFRGPAYLPPVTQTTQAPEMNMTIGNRFNEDGPVWDVVTPASSPQATTTTLKPTRRTRPPGARKTFPPLVRNTTRSESTSINRADSLFSSPPSIPPAAQASLASQPLIPPRPPQQVVGPTACVWAIITCCSTTGEISYDCFEARGCPGAFWDTNPCGNEFAAAAIASGLNYYNKK